MKKVEIKYKIWYIMLKIDSEEKIKLIKIYKNEKNIYDVFYKLIESKKVVNKNLFKYNKEKEMEKSIKLCEYMKNNNIKFISYNDDFYPEKLKCIKDAPYGLFYKGNINLINSKIVAIVGARKCTNYGVEVTRLLTKELNNYNITIISGGARGIDTVAHSSTIVNKGNTIVVLGCGIDIAYPKENFNLFNKVLEEGLIISEFLPKTAPYKFNFPYRNRIISALSDLLIVVEAAEKSGSLITAELAAEQGKEVFAVPGMIFQKSSQGCNKLIRDGAIILSDFHELYKLLKINPYKNDTKVLPVQEKILSLISNEPTHIDDIINKSFIDREALYKVLFEMQIRKEIISLPGNYYAKII